MTIALCIMLQTSIMIFCVEVKMNWFHSFSYNMCLLWGGYDIIISVSYTLVQSSFITLNYIFAQVVSGSPNPFPQIYRWIRFSDENDALFYLNIEKNEFIWLLIYSIVDIHTFIMGLR